MAARIIRSLFQSLGLMHKGKFEQRCDSELERVLQALDQHPDEKASATITIQVVVTKLGDRLDITPKVEAKLPKEKGFTGAIFWPLEGGLSVQHPSQADMFAPREASARESSFG